MTFTFEWPREANSHRDVVGNSTYDVVVVCGWEKVHNLGPTDAFRVWKRSEGERDFVWDESCRRRDSRETCIERSVTAINTGRDKAILLVRVIGMARLMDLLELMVSQELIHG